MPKNNELNFELWGHRLLNTAAGRSVRHVELQLSVPNPGPVTSSHCRWSSYRYTQEFEQMPHNSEGLLALYRDSCPLSKVANVKQGLQVGDSNKLSLPNSGRFRDVHKVKASFSRSSIRTLPLLWLVGKRHKFITFFIDKRKRIDPCGIEKVWRLLRPILVLCGTVAVL